MKKSNFALRIQPSLLNELRRLVEEEQTSLNQFINVAVAEKISAMRTAETFFSQRTTPEARQQALKILERAGNDESPRQGDELPAQSSS